MTEARSAVTPRGETHPLVPFLLGEATVAMATHRYTQALALLTKAFLADPESPRTFLPLAGICQFLRRWDDVERFSRMRLACCPDDVTAWYHLAGADLSRQRFLTGLAFLQETVARDPHYVSAWIDLGCVWKKLREIRRAIDSFQRAVDLDPTSLIAHDGLVFTMLFSDHYTPAELFKAHLAWNSRHGALPPRPPAAPPLPAERLRIGYLSPDFREHSVALFIEPVLASHDRSRFEIYCYHTHPDPDAVTARIRSHVEHWRDIAEMGDDEAEHLIRGDGLHILVELAGHTAWNRLPLLARRPAPVQVTWLGYPHSTGMTAVDYRITDAVADPPGMSDQWHTERLVRLPAPFITFQPPEAPQPSQSVPCSKNGYITLASFNNLAKVSSTILACWRDILVRLPDARLLLKAEVFDDQEATRMVVERLGIPSERLLPLGKTPDRSAHLALYGQVDIALDTFPYNGTTTTCEALYMGVPVVSLAGQTHAARVGATLLGTVGLADLVTETEAGYVEAVVGLAHDMPRLLWMRHNLRDLVARSPLMDHRGFTAALEAEYRLMWQRRLDDAQVPGR